MPDFLRSLLGLGTARTDAGLEFTFANPLPAYQWAILGGMLCVLAIWSYRGLAGPRWARSLLAAGRCAVLALLAFLMAGPQLVRSTETIEKDCVVVLVDRSSSLRIPDAPGEPGTAATREQQLRAALSGAMPTWQTLSRDRTVIWMGFDSGTFELKPLAAATPDQPPAFPVILAEPAGRQSNLGAALDAAVARAAARPIAGIVVLSDGRATDTLPRTTLRKLASQQIGVYTVALGSAEARADLAVRSVVGPSAAFVNDLVPVQVQVERTGSPGTASSARVQLLDPGGAVLDERTVAWNPDPNAPGVQGLTLTARPDKAGDRRFTVRIVPDTPDLLPGNNSAAFALSLVDRPLRVLYIDGYPRWEYRYLKNLLAREKSMSFAATLLSIGRRYLQEGSETLDSIPSTPDEWKQWDVVMIGDVSPDVFTTQQLQLLKARVSDGGAGLLWIAGEGAVPTAWRSTPLADLLPLSLGSESASIRSWGAEVMMKPTPLADALGVLRLQETTSAAPGQSMAFWPAALNNPRLTWPRLRWVQRLEPGALKPATETLATVSPVSAPAGETATDLPAVVTMRFGAGRVIYVATDEIWRWRYGRGEDYPERFYLQLLRLLGRESISRSGKPAIVELLPAVGEVNQPVRVGVQLLDQRLIDQNPATVTVRIVRAGAVEGQTDPQDQPTAESPPIVLTLRSQGATGSGSRTFVGTWVPNQTGRYVATVIDAIITALPGTPEVAAAADITLPDDELRKPETDHALLRDLSLSTGGKIVAHDQLSDLATLLPRREIRQTAITDLHTLWDTPAAIILLLALLTLEWAGRRMCRLA